MVHPSQVCVVGPCFYCAGFLNRHRQLLYILFALQPPHTCDTPARCDVQYILHGRISGVCLQETRKVKWKRKRSCARRYFAQVIHMASRMLYPELICALIPQTLWPVWAAGFRGPLQGTFHLLQWTWKSLCLLFFVQFLKVNCQNVDSLFDLCSHPAGTRCSVWLKNKEASCKLCSRYNPCFIYTSSPVYGRYTTPHSVSPSLFSIYGGCGWWVSSKTHDKLTQISFVAGLFRSFGSVCVWDSVSASPLRIYYLLERKLLKVLSKDIICPIFIAWRRGHLEAHTENTKLRCLKLLSFFFVAHFPLRVRKGKRPYNRRSSAVHEGTRYSQFRLPRRCMTDRFCSLHYPVKHADSPLLCCSICPSLSSQPQLSSPARIKL